MFVGFDKDIVEDSEYAKVANSLFRALKLIHPRFEDRMITIPQHNPEATHVFARRDIIWECLVMGRSSQDV